MRTFTITKKCRDDFISSRTATYMFDWIECDTIGRWHLSHARKYYLSFEKLISSSFTNKPGSKAIGLVPIDLDEIAELLDWSDEDKVFFEISGETIKLDII